MSPTNISATFQFHCSRFVHEIGYLPLRCCPRERKTHGQFIQIARPASRSNRNSLTHFHLASRRTTHAHQRCILCSRYQSSASAPPPPAATAFTWYSQSYKKNITRHIRTLFDCSRTHAHEYAQSRAHSHACIQMKCVSPKKKPMVYSQENHYPKWVRVVAI